MPFNVRGKEARSIYLLLQIIKGLWIIPPTADMQVQNTGGSVSL